MHSDTRRTLLEVCLCTVEEALVAEDGGADRLELNQSLEVGGLTPSIETLTDIKAKVKIPVIAMIRPRPGNFCYDNSELARMLIEIEAFKQEGADGFAFGAVTPDQRINKEQCEKLVEASGGLETVFHRAFDFLPNPDDALEELIDLGFTRLLTSGQQPSAERGTDCIARLVQSAADRIEILPGAGIGPENARSIVDATGCCQVHGTFRGQAQSTSAALTTLEADPSTRQSAVDPTILRATRRALDSH